jgi:hypothetical protein
LALIVGSWSIPALAEYKPNVVGEQDITVSGVTVYTLTKPASAVSALITVQGDDVRWKGYTTDPVALSGALLDEGDYLLLDSPSQIENFGVILKSGGSGATVYVIYYGPSK